MPARDKKPAPQPTQQQPQINIQPRRGRVAIILVLCLVVFVVISQAVVAIFLSASANGVLTLVLFALLYLICFIYLCGLGWSAIRLLIDRQPSLHADGEGLTLRHLPFLGTISIPWSEVKSIHVARALFLTHLSIVPTDTRQFLSRRNLLLFAFNASARLSTRTNAALNISQNALSLSAQELVVRINRDYGVKETGKEADVSSGEKKQ
ncbi:MAG TPA: STM3941 family protein [Ktedonobacteraceae bacterium]